MATVKRYLDSSKSYNGYTITKVNSGSYLQSISVPTNERKAVLLSFFYKKKTSFYLFINKNN